MSRGGRKERRKGRGAERRVEGRKKGRRGGGRGGGKEGGVEGGKWGWVGESREVSRDRIKVDFQKWEFIHSIPCK